MPELYESIRNDFIWQYGLYDVTIWRKTLTMCYYSFTSLSTVGFGDYHPKSDQERALITVVLLLGVAVFSMVLGNFNGIMEEILELGRGYEDKENLAKFFALMKRYNDDNDIDPDVTDKIEAFFNYKWEFDKNNAFFQESDVNMLTQLPQEK